MSPRRVAALCLDAAEWTLLEAMLDAGELPHLARLRSTAVRAQLRNVRSFRSETIFGQLATGRPPEATGRWTNVVFDPATYEVGDVGADAGPHLWHREELQPALVVDMPHAATSRSPGVLQLTGWGGHSTLYPRSSQPEGLLREVDARFGPHPAFEQDTEPCWYDTGHLEALTDALCTGAHLRIDVVRSLMEREPGWRFALAVQSEAHSIGHHTWHGVDPGHVAASAGSAAVAGACARRVYRALDDTVGRFRALLPEDAALVVFAVHGMAANDTDVAGSFLVPELLHRLAGHRPLLAPAAARSWARRGHPLHVPRVSWAGDQALLWAGTRSQRVRHATAVLPDPALRLLQRAVDARRGGWSGPLRWGGVEIPAEADHASLDRYDRELHDLGYLPPTRYRRWWPTMRAFALPTFSDPHVRINLAGREANGVVAKEDYRAACDEVVRELTAARDARTGRPLVADVERPREADPFDPGGPPPDLIVYCEPGIDGVEHPVAGLIGPVPLVRTGEHSSNGFAFVQAPGLGPADLGLRPALDVAPTLAALAGAALPGIAGTPLLP